MLGKSRDGSWELKEGWHPPPGGVLRKNVNRKELRVNMVQGCHSRGVTDSCRQIRSIALIPKWESIGGDYVIHEPVYQTG